MSMRISSVFCTFGLLVVLAWPVHASASLTIVIEGTAYPAHWQVSSDLLQRLHVQRSLSARHMQGSLDGVYSEDDIDPSLLSKYRGKAPTRDIR